MTQPQVQAMEAGEAIRIGPDRAALVALASQVLPPVPLPRMAAQRIAAAHPGISVVRCAHPTLGLGIVLSLLGRLEPFARAPLGLRSRLTAGEIARGHHLLVLDHGTPVAYAGWAACTTEQAERYLGAEGISALDMRQHSGEVVAFLTLAAVSPAARQALHLAVRAALPGRPYVARRLHTAARGAPERPMVPKRGIVRPLIAPRAAPTH